MAGAISDRLRYLSFFVARPQYLPELARKVYFRLAHFWRHRDPANERKAAEQWAADHAVDTFDALRVLTGRNCRQLTEIFPTEMRVAKAAEAACPVKMGGAGDVDLIYHLCETVSARNVVETGVAYGYSSLAILLSLSRRQGSTLISVDMPYPGMDNDDFVGCVVPESFQSNWRLLRSSDRRGLPVALKMLRPIDVAHYDSDKSYEGRLWAYALIWHALRPGGFLISDDIGDNFGFRDFITQIKRQPLTVCVPLPAGRRKYVGVLRK